MDKSFNGVSADDMFTNDFFAVGNLNHVVKNTFGINYNNRTHSTKTEAACLNNIYLIGKTDLFKLCSEFLYNFGAF